MSHAPRIHESGPVGGRLWTRPFQICATLFVVGLALTAWRFVTGLGSASALNDGYAWGIWKTFNVIVLTGIASGGYAMALLVYVLNRGRYHPLVRVAILTSALGYTTGVIALGVDIGRPWNFWRLALVQTWNLHSVLLEVAVCISIYLVFLWLEMMPPLLEQWRDSSSERIRRSARWAAPKIEKAEPWILASAVLLPTMHQSSLGSLFLLAGPRVHPLWQTPLLPLLFLLSCWALGYSCVVIVSVISGLAWKSATPDFRLLGRLSRVTAWVLLVFAAVRVADTAVRGSLPRALSFDRYAVLFAVELALVTVPPLVVLRLGTRASRRAIFLFALSSLAGGALYRLDASLIAFQPGAGWTYFPSVIELLISGGYVALAVLAYLFVVKRFAILPAPSPAAARR